MKENKDDLKESKGYRVSKVTIDDKENMIEYRPDRFMYKKDRKPIVYMTIVLVFVLITFSLGLVSFHAYFFHASVDKPVIYLYPEESTEISVKLGNPEKLTCSYPDYSSSDKASKDAGKPGGWNVIANSDGSLIDTNTGRGLYSLYWESVKSNKSDFSEGFVVSKDDTIAFLEDKLALLGLNEREAEEFIVYWLPKMQENEYNLVTFLSREEIDKEMPLEFSVQPDTLIRVIIQFKGLTKKEASKVNIEEQKLQTPERKGFVAVEWGGTEIN